MKHLTDHVEDVKEWGFGLTKVSWRKEDLKERLAKSQAIISGEKIIKQLATTGEDGVNQIRALLGLGDMVTNVNIPNYGQIPNLPLGSVVETNAVFSDNSVVPCFAGDIPASIYGLISKVVGEQDLIVEAGIKRDLDIAFRAFTNDNLVTIDTKSAKILFDEMVQNTKEYLKDYNV